jgi:hypothetical protein
MKNFLATLALAATFLPSSLLSIPLSDAQIPEPLRAWKAWALWNEESNSSATPYNDPNKHILFWPSQLSLSADATGGQFSISVFTHCETWVPLPGGGNVWPLEVMSNGKPAAVLEHDGKPALRLPQGSFKIAGVFRWNEVPQAISVPREIGILALTVDGRAVEFPVWNDDGLLWLRRDASSEETAKDFLGVKVFAAIEDGIPMWLRTQVELVVSGKSREEDIGSVLPEGWKLAKVESGIPVIVDDAGRMKVQVRPGKWTIQLESFRIDNPKEVRYAEGAKPATEDELIAFQSDPGFRMVDISGAPSIDVSQVQFPDQWKEFPVYRWNTSTALTIEERMRGMGLQKPEGLRIERQFWLGEDGKSITYQDKVAGKMQQIWRLDAAAGQDLGSVRSTDGQGLLITKNPATGAPGVEIRVRDIDLQGTGRIPNRSNFSATGWQADADSLSASLNLPPGWRLFALFGADWTNGDWLTAWTLLDLFLLLIFTLAVFRIWGIVPAILAFVAFGISYHEPGAPRYVWLALLVPLALLRVVPEGVAKKILKVCKWVMIVVFVLVVAPFISAQVQQAIYPQLEERGAPSFGGYGGAETQTMDYQAEPSAPVAEAAPRTRALSKWSGADSAMSANQSVVSVEESNSNLAQDARAKIQTGPGVPQWSWRLVTFGWNGPVQASQQVHPILISRGTERVLTILRVLSMLALAAILLDARRWGKLVSGRQGKVATAAILLAMGIVPSARADLPSPELIKTLRDRLLEVSPVYPNAADISQAALKLEGRNLTLDLEVHAGITTAIPVPGKFPEWSPLSVTIDGKAETALRRDDGYLWVLVPEGVHRVQVVGMLPEVTEWEWTLPLRPRRVTIDAPGWNFSGVRPDGVPEKQVLFSLKQKTDSSTASYDRQSLEPLVIVERNLEFGLVWQVHTTVRRLTPEGRTVAVRIPLLAGENILSSNVQIRDGAVEVRLGARDTEFTWESEMPVAGEVKLTTNAADWWIESWTLVASQVWNVGITGLPPIFEPGNEELTPVWHPWPGESAELKITRPEAIAGATVTVESASHEVAIGARQRTSKLDLSIRCSLGEDFTIDLPGEAEVTSLTLGGNTIPVRKDGTKLIVPLSPGQQLLSASWKTDVPLGFHVGAGEVRLPVEAANISTSLSMPNDRWVLWTNGPLRGPAVRFWIVLLCSLIAAWILGRLAYSPLRPLEWMLLTIGLTQVPLFIALVVVAWLFFLAWRGMDSFLKLPAWGYNLLQVVLVGCTVAALGIFIAIVAAGLLGSPEMFIIGNDSTSTLLKWYKASSDGLLPQPGCVSISIWWYRLLMLLWALWLAASLIRWLRWGWEQFGKGGFFRMESKPKPPEPPAPSDLPPPLV